MNVNINAFGEAIFKFTRSSHKDVPLESLKTQLKAIFDEYGVNDKNFSLIGLAISNSGSVETELKNSTSYINKISKRIFEKEERQKAIAEGRDPEHPEKPKQESYLAVKNLNINKLVSLSTINRKSAIIKAFANSDLPADILYKPFKVKEGSLPFELSGNKVLIESLMDYTELIAKQRKTPNPNAKPTESSKEDDLNKDSESQEKETEEKSNETVKINSTNIDVPDVRDEKLKEDFAMLVDNYNDLKTRLVMDKYPKDHYTLPISEFELQVAKVMGACRTENSPESKQMMNLCTGLIHNINCLYEDLDKIRENGFTPDTVDNYLRTTHVFDPNDSSGIVTDHDPRNTTERVHDNLDELTPEDKQEISQYGITDIYSHSEMEEFRKTEEYEMIQNMQSLGLKKDDDD